MRIGYDVLKEKLSQAIAAMPLVAGLSVRDVDVYPSAGKLVVGLRVAKAADTDPSAGKWVYLSGTVQADAGGRAIRLSNVGVMTDDEGLAPLTDFIATQLASNVNVDYGIAYDNLLNAANAKFNRPLRTVSAWREISRPPGWRTSRCPPMAW